MKNQKQSTTKAAAATLGDAQLSIHLMAARAIDSGRNADHLVALERRIVALAGWLVDSTEPQVVGAVDSTEAATVDMAVVA